MIITIKEPYWSRSAFGIAEREMVGRSEILVECSYKKSDGSLLYPDRYKMRSHKACCYPTMMARGTKLHIIPIRDFEVIQR
jgi:hypothetical protein